MPELTVNGVRLNYRLAEGPGPTLTLIHGGWLDSSAWDQHVDALSSRFTVLAPDVRGYGRSDHSEIGWTLADWGSDLIALWDALGIERGYLLGFSMGGPIALEVATRAHDRLDGLILVSTTARFREEVRQAYREGADLGPEQYEAALARHLEVAFTPHFRRGHPDFMAEYERRARQVPLASVGTTMLALAEADYVDALPRIDVPALIIHGTADQVTGGDQPATLLAGLPRSRERPFEGAGHTLHLERPDEFTRVVAEFVASTEAAAKGARA